MYFETPDLSSSRGWRSIGQVSKLRLNQFRDYSRRRPHNSLQMLVTNDDRLRDTATAVDAYSEAWAMTYFLLKQRPEEYVNYLQTLSQKAPQHWDDAEARWKDFRDAFGPDLNRLEAEFQRYISKLR